MEDRKAVLAAIHQQNLDKLEIFKSIPTKHRRQILSMLRKQQSSQNHLILPYGITMGEFAFFYYFQIK